MENNKQKVKELSMEILSYIVSEMEKDIDRAINSGALDISKWDENVKPMVIPKSIVLVLITKQTYNTTLNGKNTSLEKLVKSNVKNLLNFI